MEALLVINVSSSISPSSHRISIHDRFTGEFSELDRGLCDHRRRCIPLRSNLQLALLYFGLRAESQLRCADVRSFVTPTDDRCGRGDNPRTPESSLLGVRDLTPRMPCVSFRLERRCCGLDPWPFRERRFVRFRTFENRPRKKKYSSYAFL
jgi:hypothetical protein